MRDKFCHSFSRLLHTLGEANDLLWNPKEQPFESIRALDSSLAQSLIFISFY